MTGSPPKAMGNRSTKVVDETIAAQYPFLKAGTQLTEQFVNSLPNDEQREIAHPDKQKD